MVFSMQQSHRSKIALQYAHGHPDNTLLDESMLHRELRYLSLQDSDAAQADLHLPVLQNKLLPRIAPSRPVTTISTHITPNSINPTGSGYCTLWMLMPTAGWPPLSTI